MLDFKRPGTGLSPRNINRIIGKKIKEQLNLMKFLKRRFLDKWKNNMCNSARAGSKGLKNKNLKKLKNLPLIAHTIIQAKNQSLFQKYM